MTHCHRDTESAPVHTSNAIKEVLAARAVTGQEIPEPPTPGEHTAAIGTQMEVKLLLHRRLCAAGLTRADLQHRPGWQRESVDQVDAALWAMGDEIAVEFQVEQ